MTSSRLEVKSDRDSPSARSPAGARYVTCIQGALSPIALLCNVRGVIQRDISSRVPCLCHDGIAEIGSRFDRALATLGEIAPVADPRAPVPGTPGWSVGDVFAHLAIESDRYVSEVEGRGTWSASIAGIPDTNRRELAEFEERDPTTLLDAVRRNVDRYVSLLGQRDLDDVSHGLDAELRLTPRHAAGVLLGEVVVHGHDLAQATGRRASVLAADAAFIIDGTWRVLPASLDARRAANARASVEVRLRGQQTLHAVIRDGVASIDPPRERPDAVVSADPVAFMLLMYGRSSQLRAMVRLKVVAWGRRPDRALMLQRLFVRP